MSTAADQKNELAVLFGRGQQLIAGLAAEIDKILGRSAIRCHNLQHLSATHGGQRFFCAQDRQRASQPPHVQFNIAYPGHCHSGSDQQASVHRLAGCTLPPDANASLQYCHQFHDSDISEITVIHEARNLLIPLLVDSGLPANGKCGYSPSTAASPAYAGMRH